MNLDLPFGMDSGPIQYEPDCATCGDERFVEWGTRTVPCPDCRPAEHDYAIDVGPLDP